MNVLDFTFENNGNKEVNHGFDDKFQDGNLLFAIAGFAILVALFTLIVFYIWMVITIVILNFSEFYTFFLHFTQKEFSSGSKSSKMTDTSIFDLSLETAVKLPFENVKSK